MDGMLAIGQVTASLQLRIAYVTETYPPELNGVALTVARAVEWLRARGHSIDLIRPRQIKEKAIRTDDELRTLGLPIPMYPDLRIGISAPGALRTRWLAMRPDLVHVATEGPLGWAAARAARALCIPVTSDFRTNFHQYSNFYGLGFLEPLVGAYLRRFHNATERTFVPTSETQRALLEVGFERVEIVSRGVDTQLFSPAHRDSSLRDSWGAAAHTPVLLYVGRLAREKNVPLALRAFKKLRLEQPHARMVVVGDGPLRQSLAASYPDVIFTGLRRGPDLARYYASADLFVFPSLTETFGNVTLEALASGLAVVAYRSGAASALIENSSHGQLIVPGNESDFIAAVCALGGDASSIAAIRKRAREVALQNSWDSVLVHFEAALLETVQQGGLRNAPTCAA